jgi:hypothetical protein
MDYLRKLLCKLFASIPSFFGLVLNPFLADFLTPLDAFFVSAPQNDKALRHWYMKFLKFIDNLGAIPKLVLLSQVVNHFWLVLIHVRNRLFQGETIRVEANQHVTSKPLFDWLA